MTFVPVVYVKGQYNHLITRSLQDLGIESKLLPSSTTPEELERLKADGLVMGGGPQSVRQLENLPRELADAVQLIRGVTLPMLCICVTHQLLAKAFGGETDIAKKPEYGPVEISVDSEDTILTGVGPSFTAWESHTDEVVKSPPGFHLLAHSNNCTAQAMRHENGRIFGVQFHPEVSHTSKGSEIFRNFLQTVRQ
ncbi:MAG: hypothetical protein AUJ07_03860 [Crenarchaeota archaeon 13_1_40CM_3_53_5]|nr:MAG: hypothetical protein AUJ07_03860 [Crenarchaeota archaeon 13_1_40CM_3_53_5]